MERTGKELLIASRRFADENLYVSWWHLVSTIVLLAICVALAVTGSWYVSLPASLIAGLAVVRMFILYHDYHHGAILKNSRLAQIILNAYGMLVMSPPSTWKYTHDDHHKHNSKSFGAELGAFPIMTTNAYASSPAIKRFGYRVLRNPLIILFGYLTSFFWNKSLRKFLQDPVRNRTAGLSVLLHFTVLVVVGYFSIKAMLLGIVVPLAIGAAIGTYLFYAQHNFPGMKRKEGKEWDHVYAALQSSSFMRMNRVMHWFTGNIGYHHVHHLNAKIPFYRLPEAMAALKELQTPTSTSLSPIDIIRCLRLKLWDPVDEKLLTFREARLLSR